MFPDRVGRVVLDGVVDADLYVSPMWSDSIRDADAIFNSFSRYCHLAKDGCLLYRDGDKVEDVQNRFQGALESVKTNPITIVEDKTKSPVIVTYSDFRMLMFAVLYGPTAGFPAIAYFANLLYLGQREAIGQLLASSVVLYDLGPICDSSLPTWSYPTEAQVAIMCSDKRYPVCRGTHFSSYYPLTKPSLMTPFPTWKPNSRKWPISHRGLMFG